MRVNPRHDPTGVADARIRFRSLRHWRRFGRVRAGRVAASLGKRVGIAEEYRFGGTCVVRGCVPKKLLVYASQFSEHFEDARGFGWSVGATSFDWPALIAAKDAEIARLEGSTQGPDQCRRHDIDAAPR